MFIAVGGQTGELQLQDHTSGLAHVMDYKRAEILHFDLVSGLKILF